MHHGKRHLRKERGRLTGAVTILTAVPRPTQGSRVAEWSPSTGQRDQYIHFFCLHILVISCLLLLLLFRLSAWRRNCWDCVALVQAGITSIGVVHSLPVNAILHLLLNKRHIREKAIMLKKFPPYGTVPH